MNTKGVATMLLLLAGAVPSAALCRISYVGPDGACHGRWTPTALLEGPTVILDAPLVPIRFLAGAVAQTRACEDCTAGACLARGAGYTLIAATYGTFAAYMDATMGFVGLLSAGFIDWVEPDPIRFTLRAIRFEHSGDVCCFWGRPYPSDDETEESRPQAAWGRLRAAIAPRD
jgi:hypothetical protein